MNGSTHMTQANYCETLCPFVSHMMRNSSGIRINSYLNFIGIDYWWRVIVPKIAVVDSNIGGSSTDCDFYTPKIILQSSTEKGLQGIWTNLSQDLLEKEY